MTRTEELFETWFDLADALQRLQGMGELAAPEFDGWEEMLALAEQQSDRYFRVKESERIRERRRELQEALDALPSPEETL